MRTAGAARHRPEDDKDAPTTTCSARGVNLACRDLGPRTRLPVVLLTHLAAVLESADPRVVDGIGARTGVV